MSAIQNLTSLPATDCNFESALKSASKAQIQLAIKIMQASTNKQHKTRIAACEHQLKAFDNKSDKKAKPVDKTTTLKAEVKKSTTAKATTKASAKKDERKTKEIKIVEFPGEKPKIKTLPKSQEQHTYEECLAKLMTIEKKYTDEDNLYVINGLIERCKKDQDFRNNLMREDKTYDGFYRYMLQAARKGYCIKVGDDCGMLDKEKALDLAFDYFNMEEIIKPKEKKQVAKKLTKEVNKIAKEVNEKSKEEPDEQADDVSTESLAEETTGQLRFEF